MAYDRIGGLSTKVSHLEVLIEMLPEQLGRRIQSLQADVKRVEVDLKAALRKIGYLEDDMARARRGQR